MTFQRLLRPRVALCVAILVAIGAAFGLLSLERALERAYAADQIVAMLDIQSARVQGWGIRAARGDSNADELPIIRARIDDVTRGVDDLRVLLGSEPAVASLVEAIDQFLPPIGDEMAVYVAGDTERVKATQVGTVAPRYAAVSERVAPARAVARGRVAQAGEMLSVGTIGMLMFSLALTSLLAWGAGRARHVAQRMADARFRALIQNATDWVAILDARGTITFSSPAAEAIVGSAPADLLGTTLADLSHPDDRAIVEAGLQHALERPGAERLDGLRLRDADGDYRDVELVWRNLLREPGVLGVVLTVRDVTAQKALQDQLVFRALHDPLTQLPNRAFFVRRLEHAFARGARVGARMAILFVDLDNFKVVNDTLGHRFGDALLVTVAERLRAHVRPDDTVARLGGDEFVVLLEDVRDEDPLAVAGRCIAAMGEPLDLNGQIVRTRASIGIAISDGTECGDPEELLRQADVAMYAAKGRGKDCAIVFTPDLELGATCPLPLPSQTLQSDLKKTA